MARIYLGGPSAEIDLVLEDAKKLLAAGHFITEPWWERVHEAKPRGFAHDAEVPDEYMAESARRNEEGLAVADAIVLRMLARTPGRRGLIGGPSGGAGYELGWVKGYLRAFHDLLSKFGAGLPKTPIFIIGDPLRFIGIWTEPKPIRVPHIEAVIEQLPRPVA